MRRLNNDYFQLNTVDLARDLLGKVLVHETEQGILVGRIVETEAYLSIGDCACHASRGKTARNAAMFGRAGTAYVYLIYGLYYCFNVVTQKEGVGEAILIRALEPLQGLDIMAKQRGTDNKRLLTSGPGRLCQAMNIGTAQNGTDLCTGSLYLANSDTITLKKILTSERIGISSATGLPLRFYLDNTYVSRK